MWHDREFRLAYLECLENIAFVEWCIATVEMKQVLLKYSANQPRAPRGQSNGGQWVAAGGGSGGRSGGIVEKKPPRKPKPNETPPITPMDKPSEEEDFPVVDLISNAVNAIPLVRRLRGAGGLLRVSNERLARIKDSKWTYGSHKSKVKWENRMKSRDWTEDKITDVIINGDKHSAPNKVNKGNTATRYQKGDDYVVRDDITKEILQVSKRGHEPNELP